MTVMRDDLDSWGRLDRGPRAALPFDGAVRGLPFGLGRSYGDTCHDDDGTLSTMRDHAGIENFDPASGLLTARAGTTIGEIIEHALPSGWFPPVVPGTRFVTLGGAIANDVHGKNHHRRGTFGRHVTSISIARSDERTRTLNTDDTDFGLVVGAMGLTGIIERATVQLMKVPGGRIRQHVKAFGSVEEFIDRSSPDERAHEYSVGWIDALASGPKIGSGIVLNGDHVEGATTPPKRTASVPFTPPISPLNRLGIAAFNALYRRATLARPDRLLPAHSFFFPLDSVRYWNRLYGPRGLYQHQCVVPDDAAADVLPRMLRAAQEAGHPSFLTVLKRFGDLASPGLVSFPSAGFTLTLDFAAKGATTLTLLDRLDAMVIDAGGRTNAYKDARMSGETYRAGQPDWVRIEAARDPVLDSNFWRRAVPDDLRHALGQEAAA